MSVYNSNVETKILDPVFDRKNFRTEFRLDEHNAVYLSNWRLDGMGIVTNGNLNAYNPILGTFCMNSIQLYDGNQLLDQILSADLYKAFKTFNNSNDENKSINNWVDRGSYGFETDVVNGDNWQDWANNLPNVGDIRMVSALIDEFTISDTQGETDHASWFSLKGFLPILSSSLYLPSMVYKNLRLVINWKNPSQLKEIAVDTSGVFETYENCSLIVDMVRDDKIKDAIVKNYKGVVFRAIEHDRVQVNQINPAAGSKLFQNNRFLVNGFNNKTVERMFVVQTPTNEATHRDPQNADVNDGIGAMSSMAQLDNQFQFRVNGQNKLPRDGYTRKNQRLAALVDAYGECCLPTASNFVYVPNMFDLAESLDNDDFIQGMLGQIDWTGIEIREPVKELIVEYNRGGVDGNPKLNQPLRLNMFAECVKAISVGKDMNYVVQYL